MDRRSSSKYERLESELQGYKTNLIKESIRLGYNDLGDFHYEKGDLAVSDAESTTVLLNQEVQHSISSCNPSPQGSNKTPAFVGLCELYKGTPFSRWEAGWHSGQQWSNCVHSQTVNRSAHIIRALHHAQVYQTALPCN